MRTQSLSAAKRLFLLLAAWVIVLPALRAQELGESCYYFLGDHPGKTTPGWNQEAQGIAHDRDHWFITQDMKIWKIPVSHDLNSNAEGAAGVITRNLRDVTPLRQEGYNHFGDPECHEFRGQTFLLVPVERQPHPAAIALFRADSLAYVAHTNLDQQTQAPWCAVDTNGNVYSSNFDVSNNNPIRKYTVDWERVVASGELRLSLTNQIVLRDESVDMSLPSVQGGVITPSGTLIYLVAGYDGRLLGTDGIHVFDLGSGRRVSRSTRGSGFFRFDWDPSNWPGKNEEPEGLTFWDLDDGRAPGISGQLHVLLLDNDWPDDDCILVKHYTGTLHVDRSYGGTGKGTPREPFNTVNEANDRIWDGAKISIRSGSYPEALTFSKRIAVVSSGGPVTIGR